MNNSQKRGLGRAAYIGIFLAVAASVFVIAYALINNVFTDKSEENEINLDKGYTTSIDVVYPVDYSNLKIIPGESVTLKAELTNKSTINQCKVFVEVGTVDGVYNITPGSGWSLVENSNGVYVYGGETATDVGIGEKITFSAIAELAVEGSDYDDLEKEDLKISMTGLAVNSKASRENAADALADYYAGGNQIMVNALEGRE